MKNEVKKLLNKIIKDNYNLTLDYIRLDIPPKKELGDYAFPWFQLTKILKRSPILIVEELKWFLKGYSFLIESVKVDGPYLNIRLNKWIYTKEFLKYISKDNFLEEKKKNKNKIIFIDYIGANVWKPLHIWHMCTPNQWQVMINIYKKLWFKVISDSHIGDWWIIFGKLILAYKKWWEEKKLKQNAVEHLFELYVKISKEVEKNKNLEIDIRNEFSNLSKWDKKSIKLWESFTKQSIKAMNIQLARLNVRPDYNIGESFYEWLRLPKIENYPDLKRDMKEIVKELIDKKIAIKNLDNSVWVIFPDKEKIPSCVLQKRDGTHGYLASDLAAIKYRVKNWNPEKIIYFVDVRQQLHLKQVFAIADKAWWIKKDKLFHAYNWFISLKDWAMSTRKWKIIKLDKLLDEAESRAEKIILEKRDDIRWDELKKLTKIIWIWAIKYGYLKKNRETDVVFDWGEFVTFEWNSWPYLQYAYVRSIRILEKFWKKLPEKLNWFFENNKEIELVKKLKDYKKIFKESTIQNTPHIICQYSYELTKIFNSFYNNIHILNEKIKIKKLLD